MEGNKNLEQNLDSSNEKLHISDVSKQRELLIAYEIRMHHNGGIHEMRRNAENKVDSYLSNL